MQDTILILSRDPAAAALVAHTLRWRQIYCTILPAGVDFRSAMDVSPKGLVLAGAGSLTQMDPQFLQTDLPILALGGAAAELCIHYGGETGEPLCPEGSVQLSHLDSELFDSITSGERRLNGYRSLQLPDTLSPLMLADEDTIAFVHPEKRHYGVQYPIERHDPDGAQLLSNFAQLICGCKNSWDADVIIDDCLEEIRQKTEGCQDVVCAVSGGVDSTVCARLTSLAAGSRLRCIFIDTGFFHQDEPENIIVDFREYMGIEVRHIDARERFLRAVEHISSEDKKEQAVSALIREIFLDELRSCGDNTAVVLGTNFNDLLDDYSSPAAETAQLPYPVVEPLKKLFKDEVRHLAQDLQLPASFSGRQAFPAAGLAARIYGEVTEEKLSVLRRAEVCFTQEIAESGFDRKLRKFYSILIQSPENPEAYTISLRALQAGRSKSPARLPFDLLERVTEHILEDIPGVSRVVYDLTPSRSAGEME